MPNGYLQLGLYLVLLLLLAKPLGFYMARIYEGGIPRPVTFLRPLERLVYRLSGVRSDVEMEWKRYALAVLLFNTAGLAAVYLLQRFQAVLPLNPQRLGAVPPDLSFNTAVSFATNTNWQSYSGETTLSYLVQMVGLTVQNFLSAATGMAVLIALIRGFARHTAATIGNFWVDLVRGTLYVLLPLSLILAVLLVSQGVVQTLRPSIEVGQLQGAVGAQTLAVGPAASQVAIKQLGTNGGGFFNANSAHPFENPTPLSNLLEMLSILLIAAGLCITFGRMVGDPRQGRAILAAMTILFVAFTALAVREEQAGTPILKHLSLDTSAGPLQAGGNMEGKEVRFGIVNSSLWATATTAASNGSVNAMHDSFTPLGGLAPLVLMQLGEVVFGGVGSGLYGMLAFALIAVFIAGLMVGRTPEYLGKKIESFEIKMASLVILICPIVVLGGTAIAVTTRAGRAGILNPGPHGFSEILYALSSAGNNNGSAFAGLAANTPFYNILLGIAMFVARYWLIIPTLALAGSVARKKRVAAGAGTLPTHGPVFVFFLVAVVLVVGALTFLPSLAFGPIVEALQVHP
jgi:potassium-transporting ATPase potassium-binding subunit